MIFFASIASTIFYAIQITLLASSFRKFDAFHVSVLRGLSFGVTMLPILFFVPLEHCSLDLSTILQLLLACILCVFGNSLAGLAMHYLPIGIANATTTSVSAVTASISALLFLSEALTWYQTFAAALLFASLLFLASRKSQVIVPVSDKIFLGSLLASAAGASLGFSFFLVGSLSQSHHVFLIAFLWEFGIGVLGALLSFFRKENTFQFLEKHGSSTFVDILLRSSATVPGTCLFLYAMSKGAISLATIIGSSIFVWVSLFSVLLHRENLSQEQWKGIFFVFAGLFLLKIFS